MEFLVIFFLILTLSFLFAKGFQFLHIPRVLAPILLGIVFQVSDWALLNVAHQDALESLSTLGVIMLLFYIGLELNISHLRSQGKETFSVALIGFLITFFLGFTLSYFLLSISLLASLVIAAVVSVTAEGIVVQLLEENRLLKSRVGDIIVGAGVIDDVLGILMLAGISAALSFSQVGFLDGLPLLIGIGLFIFGYIYHNSISQVIDDVFVKKSLINSYDLFTYSIIFLLLFAVVTHVIGLDFTIGAILAGLLLNFSLTKKQKYGTLEEEKIHTFMKNITFGFLAYFFFFWIGYNIDISSLWNNPELGVLLTIVAIGGKFIGSIFGTYLNGDVLKNGSLIGLGMSSKGGVELIIAELARSSGLIGAEIFSAIVFMVVVATVIAPMAFNLLVYEEHGKFR